VVHLHKLYHVAPSRDRENDGFTNLDRSHVIAIDNDGIRDLTEKSSIVNDSEVDPGGCGGRLDRILAGAWRRWVSGSLRVGRRLVNGCAAFSTKMGAVFEQFAALGTVPDSCSALSAKARAIFERLPAFHAICHQRPSKRIVIQ
jgi:hypothetical protein